MNETSKRVSKLGIFSLVMITVGSVDSIRNLPASALLGAHLVFFYILAGLLFFIPSAFVAAELSSSNHQRGGVYDWVSHAFGPLTGVLAVWFQWTENLFWYPTILSFIASTVGFLIAPSMATNRLFISGVIIITFWLVTIVNLLGIRASARFATFCTLSGLILPMIVIIGCGIFWSLSGHPVHVHFKWSSVMPNFHDHTVWSSLNAVILSLMGIEIATVHAKYVERPQRVYPLALLISGIILLLTLVGGSLSIAGAVAHDQISPLYGIVQDVNIFFGAYHMQYLIPFLIAAIVIGVVGSVNNWIIAPTSGLRYASREHNLPKIFALSNAKEAPSFLLILQGIIVTVLSLVFVYLPSINEAYMFLTAMAAQQYAFMYLLMFATGIKQRYQAGNSHGYEIPGGNGVMWLVCAVGIIATLAVIAIGFIPPAIYVGSVLDYELLILCGIILLALPAFLLFYFARRGQKR